MNDSKDGLIIPGVVALTNRMTIHIDFVNGKHLQILDKGLVFFETNDCYLVRTEEGEPSETTIRHIINKKHVMNIEFCPRKS